MGWIINKIIVNRVNQRDLLVYTSEKINNTDAAIDQKKIEYSEMVVESTSIHLSSESKYGKFQQTIMIERANIYKAPEVFFL